MTCEELSVDGGRWWSTLLFGELTAILLEVVVAASGLVVMDGRKSQSRSSERRRRTCSFLNHWTKCFYDHHEDCVTSGISRAELTRRPSPNNIAKSDVSDFQPVVYAL